MSKPATPGTTRCPLCNGSGKTTQVDAIEMIGRVRHLTNPRPATCMACDGAGMVPVDCGDQDG